jgi:hypothetical protein
MKRTSGTLGNEFKADMLEQWICHPFGATRFPAMRSARTTKWMRNGLSRQAWLS